MVPDPLICPPEDNSPDRDRMEACPGASPTTVDRLSIAIPERPSTSRALDVEMVPDISGLAAAPETARSTLAAPDSARPCCARGADRSENGTLPLMRAEICWDPPVSKPAIGCERQAAAISPRVKTKPSLLQTTRGAHRERHISHRGRCGCTHIVAIERIDDTGEAVVPVTSTLPETVPDKPDPGASALTSVNGKPDSATSMSRLSPAVPVTEIAPPPGEITSRSISQRADPHHAVRLPDDQAAVDRPAFELTGQLDIGLRRCRVGHTIGREHQSGKITP
jgi:hypothetical protein